MVPFPVKTLSLLIADYQQNRDARMKGDSGGVGKYEEFDVDESTEDTQDSDNVFSL